METAPSIREFDYTIFDGNNRMGVKDGKKFPITEAEWQEAHPEHSTIGCTECTFVQDLEALFIYLVPREVKERATSDPEFVGKFTKPGLTTHFNFYVFKCPFCGNVTGASISSVRRLWCSYCKDFYRLDPVRHRKIITQDRDISDETLKHYINKDRRERGSRIVWSVGLGLLALWTVGIFFLKYFRILN